MGHPKLSDGDSGVAILLQEVSEPEAVPVPPAAPALVEVHDARMSPRVVEEGVQEEDLALPLGGDTVRVVAEKEQRFRRKDRLTLQLLTELRNRLFPLTRLRRWIESNVGGLPVGSDDSLWCLNRPARRHIRPGLLVRVGIEIGERSHNPLDTTEHNFLLGWGEKR